MKASDTPAKLIRQLYGDFDHGYDLDKSETRIVRASKSSPTYGEIMPAATHHLLTHLKLGEKDVLYDLGSGVGKFIIQAAMTVKAKKMVGVELAQTRHEIAQEHLALAKKEKLLRTKNVKFECEDILKLNLSKATVIYTCSTAFPERFMKTLTKFVAKSAKKGVCFISLQELPENPFFEKQEHLRLDMSWKRKTKVHIYKLVVPNRK